MRRLRLVLPQGAIKQTMIRFYEGILFLLYIGGQEGTH